MPEEGLPNGSSFRLPVSVTSTQDGSVDMVLAWTAVGAFPGSSSSQAPDLVIGDMLSEAGDGIYNSTGEDQTFAKSVQAGETAYYDIALQNDSTTAQKFVLTLPAPAGAGWEVRLVDADGGDVDITDDARDIAGAVSPEMQPGEEYLLYVAVTPDAAVADNAVQESLLVATTEDGSQQDAVKMETTRLPKSGDTDPTEPPDPTKVLPAPVITPNEGTYTGMVKVNITPGAQSPSATIIYYSLDGSEPGPGNPASRPSSGTILLVQNATVKAKAYAIGFNPSPDASATYVITQEPGSGAPGVNIATPGDGAEITAPTAVTGDVNSDNLAYWELGVRPMAANQSTDGPWQRIAWGETHVKDVLGNETITSYDDRDRQTSVEDALHKITSFTYDDAGKVLSTTFADNTTTSTIYDELGRAIQQTDQAGHVTKFVFDELGRLVGVAQVMDASDSSKDLVTTYAYDEVGNKILQTDAKGNRTEFAYDNMGRLTGRKLPGGQIEAMLYNSIGQLNLATLQAAGSQPKRFSLATYKQQCHKRHLLTLFSDKLGIDWTYIKTKTAFQELCNYGDIAH